MAFFLLALRTFTLNLGFYIINYNKEAKSLTFRRGSAVSQVKRKVLSGPGKAWAPLEGISRISAACAAGVSVAFGAPLGLPVLGLSEV